MADFSPSGIEGMPALTADSLQFGDPRVMGWLREAVIEGDRINRSDPMYDLMELGMKYVAGEQGISSGSQGQPPSYLPRLTINQSRKVMQAHVSALTDIKPLFAYKATNPRFSTQANVLNQLTVAWWVTQMCDIAIADCVKYGIAAGTGDLLMEWDPTAGIGGDVTLTARDARDTLPWRPAPQQKSIQMWEGLTLRESHTVNVMRALYPEYADKFRPTTDSLLSTLMGRFKQVISRLVSPGDDTLSGLSAPAISSRTRSGEILLYKTYLTDRTKNLTGKPIPMGRPGTSWAYLVPPGGYLYPYKRLIVATPEFPLYDGPNPYWHGQYPVSRLMPWSLPWYFLGRSLLADLLPLQNGINQAAQDLFLGVRKWMDPTVLYNKGAVSESFMRLFDPRRTGAKVKLNEVGAKEGFRQLDGPNPQVLALASEALDKMIAQFNDLSGTPNLLQLLELRQLPGADTLTAYWQAMTPELRQEGRMVEAFLRDVAVQHKCLRFQYESNARRVAILGDAGSTLQDFDFEPENMIPAMDPGQPGYQPTFDAALPRDVRARNFMQSIVFTIAPNSILAMNAQEQKMIALQGLRMGVIDIWTFAEKLEIANMGSPPPIPLPPLGPPPDPQLVLQSIASGQGQFTIDPNSGQILQIREPVTITERLMAQQLLGIGQTVGPASGRKASGQAPPKMEQKSDGRTTVTGSRHDAGQGPRAQ